MSFKDSCVKFRVTHGPQVQLYMINVLLQILDFGARLRVCVCMRKREREKESKQLVLQSKHRFSPPPLPHPPTLMGLENYLSP